MSLHKDQSLKEAVLNLSQKEKDKLLIRLVNKDKMLIKQLHYELLEDKSDLEDRITDLKDWIDRHFELAQTNIRSLSAYTKHKQLHSYLRQASGMVNEHEKITKDKFSVVECRLLILEDAFDLFPRLFELSEMPSAIKLQKYVQGRIKNAMTSFDKLHEDLQFDLQDQMTRVIDFAQEHRL